MRLAMCAIIGNEILNKSFEAVHIRVTNESYNDANEKEAFGLLEVSHLTKRYGDHCAVEDLSFTVEDGLVYGFLGPNGAGKSTTMNIITGCLAATEGSVTVDGHDIFDQPIAAKRCIGYLPEQPPVYPDMTPEEYLAFVAEAKGVERAAQIEKAIAVTGIDDVRGRLIRNLSKGYRQRVGIAQALLGEAKLIILDEPTVGLDPRQIIEIRELIRSLGRRHTVILSSHILSEVQAVCDPILIINKGRLIACDTPENLEGRFSAGVSYALTVKADGETVMQTLAPLEGVTRVTLDGEADGRCELTVEADPAAEDMDEKLSFALSGAHMPVLRMERREASLEDVFLSLTADDKLPQPEGEEGGEGHESDL